MKVPFSCLGMVCGLESKGRDAERRGVQRGVDVHVR